jgi:serine O-acetyltransferase
MFKLISSIRHRDPARPTFCEVFFAYPGFHAVAWHRISHFLWHIKLKALARFASYLARVWTGIEIHPAVKIGERLFIDHGIGTVIGATAEIGDDVTLYHGVTLGGRGNDGTGKRHPTLKNNVMVGAGAQVLGDITMGEYSRVGANSVVTKDLPDSCTAIGIPARIVSGMEKSASYGLPYSIDPDPVGKTIGKLLDDVYKIKKELKILDEKDSKSDYDAQRKIGEWMGDSI